MSRASIAVDISSVQPSTIKRFLDATLKLPPLRRDGFTHPTNGHWVMLPDEFSMILAHESKAVTQVLLETFLQTVGKPGDGPGGRKLWAKLSVRHFVRKGLMSRSQAEDGIKQALNHGYLRQRRTGKQTFEYAVHFKDIEY